MQLTDIYYYKENDLLIYPKNLSGQTIIEKAKQQQSKIQYEKSSVKSSLKIDHNGLVYLEEIEKYNIECTSHTFKKNDFKNNGEFHSPQLGTLQYINYVGITEFLGLKLYILNKKIDEKEYQKMIKEIENKVAELIFDFNKPTFINSKTNIGTTSSISYHSLRLLMYLLETSKYEYNIYNNLDLIFKGFHIKMDTDILTSSFYETSYLDDDSISNLLTDSIDFTPYNNSNFSNNTLVRYIKRKSGKDLVPNSYKRRNIIFNTDNHENRFIKFFLKQCILILEYYKKKYMDLSKYTVIDQSLLTRINHHIKKMNYILQSNYLKKIGNLSYIPFESQVLTKKDGYRQIFKSFLLLNSQHTVLFNDEINYYIDSKSIDKIYEIWCFFALVEQLEHIYSTKSINFVLYDKNKEKKFIVSNDGNTHFFIKGNIELPSIKIYFKKTFSYPDSYSQIFAPDITIEILDGSQQLKNRIFFDAKFKLDISSGNFKSEDINKMHTYLDAISKSFGSYILYPGTKNQTFLKSNVLVGVGAFYFSPFRKDNIEMRSFLSQVLRSLK